MKNRLVDIVCFLIVLAVVGLAGCGKDAGPPPPLPAEQIPAEVQRVFNNAGSEAKEIVGRVVSALQNKDYTAAYDEVQALCALPGETQEQRSLAARALLTLTGLLQTAQAQGDEKAAAALNFRRTSR